jgi:hypothetical protein
MVGVSKCLMRFLELSLFVCNISRTSPRLAILLEQQNRERGKANLARRGFARRVARVASPELQNMRSVAGLEFWASELQNMTSIMTSIVLVLEHDKYRPCPDLAFLLVEKPEHDRERVCVCQRERETARA